VVGLRKALVAVSVGVWLGGALACVDTTRHASADGSVGVTCQVATSDAGIPDASIPSATPAPTGPYTWKNVVIKGGGFVSGIVMSRALSGLAFARTDVGGAYRFDPAGGRWAPITDWVSKPNSNLIGIESIAADPVDPNRVYLAAGEYTSGGNGYILSSTDMGQTWTQNNIGAPMGGNADGRNLGERLVVDPNLPSTLYFGSRTAGLWTSADFAQTWTQVATFSTALAANGESTVPTTMGNGYGLSFVLFDPSSGSAGSATPTIYVGVGITTGPALYRSTDAGATWQPVVRQPTGMMPHHAVLDGCGNVYLAYNNGSGPNGVTAGAVWRYAPTTAAWTDVSPVHNAGFGFGGISADAAHPGTLLVTTIDDWSPGEIYRTTNGGASWVSLVKSAAWDVNGAQWLYWHTGSLPAMGWMGNAQIDPFDSSHALFITGQGLWSSHDFTAADGGAGTHWSFADDGLEETVALDLASPPAGPPQSPTTPPLLTGVGDIGGFRHDDLDVSPPNGMFANPIFGNTNSLDFAESAPSIVARVGTASSTGSANGAYSLDGGTTWMPFAMAPSGSTGSGSIAVSADGMTFVWAPKKGTPSYSINLGSTWTASVGLTAGMLVAADRVNASKFYASGRGMMLVSIDGGATFNPVTTPSSGRPRPVFGVEGDLWVATSLTSSGALLHSQDSGGSYTAVPGVNGATAVGFGAPVMPGQTYPSVYLAGSVLLPGAATSVWGLYRSDDGGTTWQHLDDPQHQFGYINVLAGDPRQPGRVYLGTSGRGIVYGDPQTATVTQ
jgi:hypothetical protein